MFLSCVWSEPKPGDPEVSSDSIAPYRVSTGKAALLNTTDASGGGGGAGGTGGGAGGVGHDVVGRSSCRAWQISLCLHILPGSGSSWLRVAAPL